MYDSATMRAVAIKECAKARHIIDAYNNCNGRCDECPARVRMYDCELKCSAGVDYANNILATYEKYI